MTRTKAMIRSELGTASPKRRGRADRDSVLASLILCCPRKFSSRTIGKTRRKFLTEESGHHACCFPDSQVMNDDLHRMVFMRNSDRTRHLVLMTPRATLSVQSFDWNTLNYYACVQTSDLFLPVTVNISLPALSRSLTMQYKYTPKRINLEQNHQAKQTREIQTNQPLKRVIKTISHTGSPSRCLA